MPCQAQNKRGTPCGVPTKNAFCHMHKDSKQVKELQEKLQISNDFVDELEKTIRIMNNKLKEANQKIKNMKSDYNNFQIVKQFESQKKELERQAINFFDRGYSYHKLRKERNHIVHELTI